MISSYNALKDLIDEKLNANPNGIVFDTHLYNRARTQYQQETNNVDDNGVTIKKIVPANIVEIVGNYINIPNTSVTENAISLEFDIFRDSYTSVPLQEQSVWQSVDYLNTISAIDDMIQSMLATYHPLGDVNMYFGGTDSKASFDWAVDFKWNTIYLDLDIKNRDSEVLLEGVFDITNTIVLSKDLNNIILTVKIAGVDVSVSTAYTVGNNKIYVYYDASNNWNLTVNGVNTQVADARTQLLIKSGSIAPTNTLEGILHQLLIDDSVITPTDIENGIENAISPKLNFKDFTNRYELNNVGSYALTTNDVENCILWGEDGNAIFGFETLVPISDVRFIDDGRPRQLFGLGINCIVTKDILVGNLFEYFLDGVQIYPIDRQHTYAGESDSTQYINDKYGKTLISSNMKDIVNTFFVKPNKQTTLLMKQITDNDQEQNNTYILVVQYPFHKVTYNVVVDSGGVDGNINNLTTLTVTYKQKDDSVT